MAATIGWIDFSPKDRSRVGSILDLLKPEGQVDELGIGTMRDALSNRLFPGISTIQTRAKYFFIIPYILQDYLKLPVKDRKKIKPTQYLKQREFEVMWDLSDKYKALPNKGKNSGVIGITKPRGKEVVRRPSEIYWNGLNTFKCLNALGLSANVFLNSRNSSNLETLVETIADEDGDDKDAGFENYFNIKVPANEYWEKDLDVELTYEEASFLKDAIIDTGDSILALVVQDEVLYQEFLKQDKFVDFARICSMQGISEQLKKDIVLAHDFAILMEGAHIAYNQELQKQFHQQDYFEEDWNAWYKNLKGQMIDYKNFNPQDIIFYATTTKGPTQEFVEDWWALMQADSLNEEKKKNLVRNQEGFAKKRKARLKLNKGHDVKENSRRGLTLLEYRFKNAKTIVKDVINGLNRKDA
jgi:hypothetical protein